MLKPPVAAAELVAVDPPADHRATLFREQLDRSLSLLERGRGLGGLSALAVGGMGWGQVPLGVLVPVVLANVLVSECAVSLDGMRRQSVVRDDRAWYHALILMMGAAGLTWGLQMGVMIAMAPSATAKMAAVAFGVGLVGANIVFGSPFRVPFWVMQAGLLLPTIVVELSSPDPALRWMGGAAILNMAFSYVLHDHVHRSLVESIDANLRLAHQAHHDPLTGLPNRAALTGALAQAMEEGARVGVLYIDLDRFKVVNDALGHDVGDQLLSAVAARLRGEVGLEGQLFRVGGDELIALLRHPASDAEVTGLATRIHAALREPVAVAGRELPVTASIGLAIGASPGESGRDLLRYADAALYRAKDLGRNRVEVFDDRMRAELRRRVDDEQAVRRALDSGEIEPWYQPIVDLRTGAIVGAEALARWRHPDRGVLAAGAFIPLVEESGLADHLTDVILTRVVADLAAWRRSGAAVLRVKVNVGAEAFARPNLALWIGETLRRHDCPPDALGVEVTETGLLTDLPLAIEHLRALRAIGLTVALDDFGTAWSSLALLRQLPLDEVKIDRMFLRDIATRAEDRDLVGTVVALAEQFHLEVVAEGVETREQAQVAAELGCRAAQGWLYAPAVPGEQLLAMLATARESANRAFSLRAIDVA